VLLVIQADWGGTVEEERGLTPSQLLPLASVAPPQSMPQVLCCEVHQESKVRLLVVVEC